MRKKLIKTIYFRIKSFNYDKTCSNMLTSAKTLKYLKQFSLNDLKRIYS